MAGRKVAIAIGVGDAKPLPYLSGAVNGARAFHEWASKVGYESRLVIDEGKDVTIARLRSEFDTILSVNAGPIHRLVIYFAGHGLIREADEGLWLLSDWNKELRAVGVENLRRRLYMHDIQQIAIFSDSCRSLPPSFEVSDLATDPVLGRGPNRESGDPFIDKFIAAQDGASTFMVPGVTPEEDRCVFSGLLLEALWGIRPDAYSKVVQGKITSQSLRDFLKSEVPKLAQRYKRKLSPKMFPAFPDGDNTYFPEGSPPAPPKFPDWPTEEAFVAMGPIDLEPVEPEPELFGGLEIKLEDTRLFRPLDTRPPLLPAPASRPRKPRRVRSIPPPYVPSLADRIRGQKLPETFGTGFAVDGAVRGLWTPSNVRAQPAGRTDWWEIFGTNQSWLNGSTPALIEFENGTFAAVTALPMFIGSVLNGEKGVSALIYRSRELNFSNSSPAEAVLAQMETGAIRADAVADLAVNLRLMKHADPVLGVISAYLYDSIGDIDSIRSMAFYYASYNQPIPYDIALLARLPGEWKDGRLWASVPALTQRIPRTEMEGSHHWTHAATPEAAGEVGGLWPWMRQGWTSLDDFHSALIHPELPELAAHLTGGRFATLNQEGGARLAEIFQLSSPYNQRAPYFTF